MTQTRRRFLAILGAAAALPGTAQATAPAWTGIALGAEATITLDGPAALTAPALAEAVAALRRVERLFSLYDAGSDLSRLNASGRLDRPGADWAALLRIADRVHHATEGRFDPTVQPLWRALAAGRDPGPARAAIGWHRIRHGAEAITLDTGQALTLNGIAQGYATDAVRAVLRRHGFTRSLVNIGEFAGDGGPWRLGLADPAQGIVLERTLADGAMATSSPGAMTLGPHGHILPTAGHAPVWSTVSVEADSATLADAASTALCMADRAVIAGIARALPGLRRITVIDTDGNIATF
ncbi:FAD:protein FMN transferase [Meridianimarinicoccus sp. RP-17]|uniref:FAD:protein FMN transferase n=1 Tax=Meridianimarinicoccus zhengii TaxID=2056810 RepID=UPI000DADCB99|nr:FAD:protein FMN transferase [Phycocomes zhengii]